jgi:hypothetical protein
VMRMAGISKAMLLAGLIVAILASSLIASAASMQYGKGPEGDRSGRGDTGALGPQGSSDQDEAFESGLNYLSSNSSRFYEDASLIRKDFEFFSDHNITRLSIRIYWKGWVEERSRLIENYNRLLNLADEYGMKVQFDFWTSFTRNVMPQGMMPFDLIRNESVKRQWFGNVSEIMNEFRNHISIESWTMMNEPRNELGHEATDRENFTQCWTEQREIMKGIDPRNLTIRFALCNSPWSGDFNNTEVFQVCDYIAINEYLDPKNSSDTTPWGGNWTTFTECISECQNRQVPLVISEFGMNTSTLENRGEYYSQSLSLFKSKGIRKAYAFAWQTRYPENESFNICNITSPTPMLLALAHTYWILSDVNNDLVVDILDVAEITGAYGATPASPSWNIYADVQKPYGKIDICDLILCTGHYGETHA